MSRKQQFMIASSIEPSGVTWLLNCLLYLDILCYRGSTPDETWITQGDTYRLRPKHEELRRWLPVTSERSAFNFGSHVECEWSHELPGVNTSYEGIILFSRDPRGSILSRYKRDYSHMQIDEFLRILEPRSLLTVPDYLDHFYRAWMERPNVLILRFEDYKEDPLSTLRTAVEYLGLSFHDRLLKQACNASTFEKAVESERLFLSGKDISEKKLMNRAGSSSEWRQDLSLQSVKNIVVRSCNQSLFDLGYIPQEERIPLEEFTFSQEVQTQLKTSKILFASYYTQSEKLALMKALSVSSLTPFRLKLTIVLLGACFQFFVFVKNSIRGFRAKVR